MTAWITFIIGLVLGLGGGYALGFNNAAHPGKVRAQLAALWSKIRRK